MAALNRKFTLNLKGSTTTRSLIKRITSSQESLTTELTHSPNQTGISLNILSVGHHRQQRISDNASMLRSCSAADVMHRAEADVTATDADDLPALTRTARLVTQALSELKRAVSSEPDLSQNGIQDNSIHEKLADVLSTIKTEFCRFPQLRSTDVIDAMQTVICKFDSGDFDSSVQCREEVLSVIDSMEFVVSSSLSDCLAMRGCEAGNNFAKAQSLDCLTQVESKSACEADVDLLTNVGSEEDSSSTILDDSAVYKLESGVDIALSRAQSWSKYVKELASYVERRINLWDDFVRGVTKLAKSVEQTVVEDSFLPMQQLFCSALSQDMELANMSHAARSLILNQTFVAALTARRTEHDKIRKNLKLMWTKQVRKLLESVSNLRKAKAAYITRQQDYEKVKELAQKAENESHTLSTGSGAKLDAKIEKKRKQEEEAMQKAAEAEMAYRHCVQDANDQQKQLEDIRRHVLRMIRRLLVESDSVLKECTSGYFKLMTTVTEVIPQQFMALQCETMRYNQGSHYLEYINQLNLSNYTPVEVRCFAFEPCITTIKSSDQLENQSNDISRNHDGDSSPGGSTMSLELLSTTGSYNKRIVTSSSSMAEMTSRGYDDDYLNLSDNASTLFRGIRLSLDAQSHSLRKLRAPSRCARCDSLVYLQGAECEKCGIASHKKCLEVLRVSCSCPVDGTRGTGTVSLDTSIRDEVPFILVKCIQEIDKRGLGTKGIYRISSVKSRVEQVCCIFETNDTNVNISDQPPNIIANVLKFYLRQLSEPLLTFRLYGEFIELAKDEAQFSSISQLLSSLNQLTSQLPPVSRRTCNILMHHLSRVSKNQEVNQMNSTNLGIVFGPTLLWPKEGAASLNYLIETPYQTRIIELMIDHVQVVFGPDEGLSLQESHVVSQQGLDVCRIGQTVRRESDSTNAGYSSWFAPDFTHDLLAELEPHFLRLQNDSLPSSDRLVLGRLGDEISTTFTDSDCQLSSSTSTEKETQWI